MPERTDISKILILSSGPIVIGQSGQAGSFAGPRLQARRKGHKKIGALAPEVQQ